MGLIIDKSPIMETRVVFSCRGEVVGQITSTHDFSELPKELHQLGVDTIGGGANVGLPADLYDYYCGTPGERAKIQEAWDRERLEFEKRAECLKHPFREAWRWLQSRRLLRWLLRTREP